MRLLCREPPDAALRSLLLQERYLEQLLATPLLTDHEREIIKWGKNAKITIPKRLSRSGAHTTTYRNATALECLVSHTSL